MNFEKPVIAFAVSTCILSSVYASEPQPMVIVKKSDMPSTVSEKFEKENVNVDKGIVLYHELRESFGVSHTVFAKWLGVKRRTMYNWLNDPASSTRYGSEIEERLTNLKALKNEMEVEHLPLLHKIAYSPIYGNPSFGELIESGAPVTALEVLYDETFSLFEDYRSRIG